MFLLSFRGKCRGGKCQPLCEYNDRQSCICDEGLQTVVLSSRFCLPGLSPSSLRVLLLFLLTFDCFSIFHFLLHFLFYPITTLDHLYFCELHTPLQYDSLAWLKSPSVISIVSSFTFVHLMEIQNHCLSVV